MNDATQEEAIAMMRGSNRLVYLLIAVILLSLLGNCGAWRARQSVLEVKEDTEKIVYRNFTSKINFGLVDLREQRLGTGQLQVELKIENWRKRDTWCEVQTVFKNARGFEVEKTNWEPILFEGRKVTHYRTNSLSSEPVDFTIFVRRLN